MASRTKVEDEIRKLLKDDKVITIVLNGDAGVGKTWIARKISDSAITKDLSYMTLWVFLNQRDDRRSPHHSRSLHENIARQLSVLSTTEEWEDNVSKEEDQEEESLESLKKKICAKLEEIRSGMPEQKKFLLLILDGVPDTMNDDAIVPELKALLQLNQRTLFKVLITRRKEPVKEGSESKEMNEVTEIESEEMKKMIEIKPLSEEMKKVIEIEPLREDEGFSLFENGVTKKVKEINGFETRAREIVKKSKGLPAAIIIIAEALNRIGEHDSEIQTLEGALEEAVTCEEAPDNVNPLLRSGYDMLPRNDMALINCCWHSQHFFSKHGGVHYNELIACWILEGFVGPADLVEEAYKEGHRVLMELIDRHILKIQDDNVVVMEGLALTVPDCRQDGYEGTSSLGLASVFGDGGWQSFGRITQADGMIKTMCNRERWDKMSTLLIDGSRLWREVLDTFFQPMQGLQVLALFNPTFRSLPSTLSKMENLHLLVLRGCDLLEDIDQIKEFKSLTVLEISGATSLRNISDDFFEKLLQLRSLKLSAVQIKSLPSSISNLSELRWLILKGCSSLEKLPKLQKLENLQVLDLSDAIKLKKLEDKTLHSHKKLRMLDVSRTQLERFPFLSNLVNLTRISVRSCECLSRLPNLKSLSDLKLLDVSGAVVLREIPEESFRSKNSLKILNLSNTAISHLPSNFNSLSNLEFLNLSNSCNLEQMEDDIFKNLRNLCHLNLSNTKIQNLPSLSNVVNLEVLNLSGCRDLTKIGDQSFKHMTRLRQLNLSETKVESLPPPNLGNLCQVILRNCDRLKELPPLESPLKLEELDLCGATSLGETEAEFLENTSQLQFLNLSGTRLKLPSMSNLTNLIQLSLRGCSFSEPEPNLGEYKKLEILDLSETAITSLSSLNNFSSLRKLKLRDCWKLKQLQHLASLVHLEVLDLWGTGIQEFPYKISELTRLKHLDLPKGIQEVDWGKIKRLPEELNWDECGIFEHSENRPCISVSGTKFFQILKENPHLWETCFKKFHFYVCPLKEQVRAGDICWHRVDPIFRKIYLRTFSLPEEHGQYLEIVGFDGFPDDFKDVLIKAEYISLIDNKVIKSLSDLAKGLKAMNVSAMPVKGCMLERCTEMKTIFGGEETAIIMEENLETLWASNLPTLNSVSSGNMQLESFKNLRQLYIDCCPKLEVMFPSSQLPKNLESLQIKFCDTLKTLFIPNTSTECRLPNLQKLHLVELPELSSIGVPESKSIVDIFPSMSSIKVRECPKLENLEEIRKFRDASVENSRTEEY